MMAPVEKDFEIVNPSGTSGGAVCTLLVWYAMKKGERPAWTRLLVLSRQFAPVWVLSSGSTTGSCTGSGRSTPLVLAGHYEVACLTPKAAAPSPRTRASSPAAALTFGPMAPLCGHAMLGMEAAVYRLRG